MAAPISPAAPDENCGPIAFQEQKTRPWRCSLVPRRLRLKQTRQPGIVGWGLIQHGSETPEFIFGKIEIAPVEQNGFCLPAGRLQHEIGAVAAKRVRRPIDQRLLASADTEIDVLYAQPVRPDCGTHLLPLHLYPQSMYDNVRTM